ncbi:endonuclease [Azomonas macrocytogenes]|uniref:Deoxyribonuclease-1 n=1 Tax=Azomonas macrocytogenes TaxID=69962 RepID=A0A839T1G7_AZOMA|nr:endonuclease [Azomonas macrocytogenes]MBB3103407.1 deoxyribonuclease-1 [Azomonas macrocytogenes]
MRRTTLTALLGLGASILAIVFTGAKPEPPKTFSEAKKIAETIYEKRPITFYCGCHYDGNKVNLASCGYKPRKQPTRAARLEWEHIVPAWVIGHQRQCWQHGGRKNCSANDPVFSAAEADLHNLVPSIGEVNGDRSNYALGMLEKKPSQYGACQMVIDSEQKTAMPPQAVRGASARIYLYMADRYKLRLSAQDRKTYEAWNRMYPVNEWERWRNRQVGCAMGWGNPYVGPLDPKDCPGQGVVRRILDLLREKLKI